MIYRSAWQWARRGYVPKFGQRHHKRGNIGQPLFNAYQVVFVGENKAIDSYRRFSEPRAISSTPRMIKVNGRWYKEV